MFDFSLFDFLVSIGFSFLLRLVNRRRRRKKTNCDLIKKIFLNIDHSLFNRFRSKFLVNKQTFAKIQMTPCANSYYLLMLAAMYDDVGMVTIEARVYYNLPNFSPLRLLRKEYFIQNKFFQSCSIQFSAISFIYERRRLKKDIIF